MTTKKKRVFPKTLQQFVMGQMTAIVFEKLQELMGWTPDKMTRRFRDPKTFTLDEVLQLSKLIEEPAYLLVTKYKAGRNNITLTDVDNTPELEEGFIFLPKSA